MGYVRERPIHRLVFDDPAMAGLTVRVRAMPFGEARHIGDRVRDDQGLILIDKVAKEFFSEGVFLDWDLEKPAGTPVPGTVEGLYTNDRDFIEAVLLGWLHSIGETMPAPLDERSTSGEKSLEASIPTEPLSPNPTS
jgi:hypothetical protein